jgi:hypothetical protein
MYSFEGDLLGLKRNHATSTTAAYFVHVTKQIYTETGIDASGGECALLDIMQGECVHVGLQRLY